MIDRICRGGLVIGSLVVLAGCVAPPADNAGQSPAGSIQQSRDAAAPAVTVSRPDASRQKRQSAARTVGATELVGRSGAELVSIMGTPALKWQRGNAALWQYSGRPCVVHVFLSGEGEAGRVERVVSRPRSAESNVDCPARFPAGG